MPRFRITSELVGCVLLVLLLSFVAIEAFSERRIEFHTGSGLRRHRILWAGYPWSEEIESTRITRLADSENWPGQWRLISMAEGFFVTRGRGCSPGIGSASTGLSIAGEVLERHEPDAARRRRLAQQLLRSAHGGRADAIRQWLNQADEAIDGGQSLPEVAGS